MDWSTYFSFDNIVKGAALVGSIVSFLVYIRSELLQLKADMSTIKEHQKMLMESLRQLNTILTQIAVQDARINMLEKDIDDLRHKRGFIE